MTGIKTLAVAGLLLAMMFSPSLSYPFESQGGVMMRPEGNLDYTTSCMLYHVIGSDNTVYKTLQVFQEFKMKSLLLLKVSTNIQM